MTYDEAMKPPDSAKWSKAIQDEMHSLVENHTWTLVNLPEKRRAIGNRWVIKVKSNPNELERRHKARLVLKEFTQKFGGDYERLVQWRSQYRFE